LSAKTQRPMDLQPQIREPLIAPLARAFIKKYLKNKKILAILTIP
jgi:hypothetical protein